MKKLMITGILCLSLTGCYGTGARLLIGAVSAITDFAYTEIKNHPHPAKEDTKKEKPTEQDDYPDFTTE